MSELSYAARQTIYEQIVQWVEVRVNRLEFKPMTVAELIEKLSHLDQTVRVVYPDCSVGDTVEIDVVEEPFALGIDVCIYSNETPMRHDGEDMDEAIAPL